MNRLSNNIVSTSTSSKRNQLVALIAIVVFSIMFLVNRMGNSIITSTNNGVHYEDGDQLTKNRRNNVHSNPSSSHSSSQQHQQMPERVYGISTVEFDENSALEMKSVFCPLKSNTYKDLGQFPFWGKIMNASFSCPAAGMNNQLTLLLAFWHCHESKQQQSVAELVPFRWKDISCSPTGGKDGNRKFVVGSSDYTYAWFRWSEVFEIRHVPRFLIHAPNNNKDKIAWKSSSPLVRYYEEKKKSANSIWKSTLCMHDSYTWKEHPELAKCNSNIGHLYGSKVWWELRGRLEPRGRFQLFAKCFLEAAHDISNNDESDVDQNREHGNKQHSSSSSSTSSFVVSPASNPLKKKFLKCVSRISNNSFNYFGVNPISPSKKSSTTQNNNNKLFSNGVLGLHVRRGDYAHFCKGLIGSSGIRKFRVPPFKWLSKNTEQQLSTKFPDTCAPSDSKIVDHIKHIITESHHDRHRQQEVGNQRNKKKSATPINTVFVASNSNSLVESIRSSLSSWKPDFLQSENGKEKSSTKSIRVISLSDVTGTDSKKDAEVVHQIWPDELYHDHWRAEKYWRTQRYSLTDKVMLDILILSLCQVVVLNRYSTFSQSVIDERVLMSANEYFSSASTSSAKEQINNNQNNNGETEEENNNVVDFSELPGIKSGIKWW